MKRSWLKLIIKFLIISISYISLHSASIAAPSIEGIQIYQKNMHLSNEHKQMLAADIYRYNNADNIWDQLRREFVLPHYENSPQVQEQIEFFLNHPDFLMHTATRAAPYLYFILQQSRKRHLPAEIVLLPMIESGYNPFAYSTAGAAGIWQMMPGTASGFGVKQNWWYDGRRDVVASTRAALDYLAYLGSFFNNNWLLAIAAYDTGEGNVISAIRKNISMGYSTEYWYLPVAQETRIYVPRLLALATIISNPHRYPFQFPPVRNAPYLAQIDIGAQIDLQHAARLAGLSYAAMKQLNPGYNRSATDPNGPFKLVLPIENVEQFTENLSYSPLSHQTNWARYKIRSGDTFASIAKRYSTTPESLKNANPTVASNLRPGKEIVIPHSAQGISKTILDSEQPFFTANNTKPDIRHKPQPKPPMTPTLAVANALTNLHGKYTLQPGDTLYMIRNGDNLKKIAKRFHTSPQVLTAVNQISERDVHAGDKLIIPTHIATLDSTQKYELTAGDTVYIARKGDNVEKIAHKFHTSPFAIRVANLLANNDTQEGDRLVIPTHSG